MAVLTSPAEPDGESRLNALGLSTELIHNALRPGLSRAANRTALALPSTPGTDIYHESMEQFHRLLADAGWRLVHVHHQPRLLHPSALLSFTLASGANVGNLDRRQSPRTRRKGKATRVSLASPRAEIPTLFEVPSVEQDEALVAAAEAAPLWLMVHERTERGLNLEFSRPAQMTDSGVVNDWHTRIPIPFLALDGDLSIFDAPDDGDFDVPVQPR